MVSPNNDRRQRPGFTLEKALGVALLLHLLFGGVVTWWPGLLMPATAAPAAEPEPLQFRLVDRPETEPPPEPPDTEALSDVDRQAADMSERDDQEDPFTEGNTPQDVFRPPQQLAEESVAEEAAPPTPEPETAEEPAEEAVGEEALAEEPAERPEELVEEAEGETVAEATETTPRVPPRRRNLRNSLAQLEALNQPPQVADNRTGGVDGPRSLAQFDTRGYDLGPYLREVLMTIERNWHSSMPPLIQTGVGGVTFVALSIRRQKQPDGSEIAVVVAERTWSSGQPAYDTAAHFSLELSNPLPPIPSFFPYDLIQGRLGYVYNLDPNQIVFPDQ